LHRDELRLDDDQVRQLQELDDQLAAANAKLGGDRPARHLGPDAGPSAPRRGVGMGMGSGGFGRGNRAPRVSGGVAEPVHLGPTLEQTMDDNDTRAYLRAEAALTDAQRERAREIAEEYREKLYDRRHREGAP
jgi:hypothetical protein